MFFLLLFILDQLLHAKRSASSDNMSRNRFVLQPALLRYTTNVQHHLRSAVVLHFFPKRRRLEVPSAWPRK